MAPPCVRPRGIAGGFRRFVGVGGGGLRRGWVCVDVSSTAGGEGGRGVAAAVAATTAVGDRVCDDNGEGVC